MSIHVAIEHRTVYKFDRPVELAPHVVRLRPAPHSRTPILSYSLTVTPTEHFVNWQQDPFGNYLARFVFPEKATELSVVVDLIADMTVINPFDFFIDDDAKHFPFTYEESLKRDLTPYLVALDGNPLLDSWLTSLPPLPVEGLAVVDFLVGLNSRLCNEIAYSIRMEPGVQTPDQTLALKLGSCRDSAWLLVQILRRHGLAARFVSGYLVQLTADIPAIDGPTGPLADFTDLHAWAEVFVPGAGWIGLDPTSGLFAGEGHIPLAATPEPSSAAAITGMVEVCETTMEYVNIVTRVREDPRVTLPYSEAQWHAIDTLGRSVDAALVEGDVRLTMGGEPTFVSVKDMESAEWTVAADGPAKRTAGGEMARLLQERFAKGGVLQYGQGKWYPGEPLPRWQISVFWRTDGLPLWKNHALLANPSEKGSCDFNAVRALTKSVASLLGVPDEFCLEAFEDPVYQLWTEARLPAGTPAQVRLSSDDVATADPSDAVEAASGRAALIAGLDRNAGKPVAMVFPLHRVIGRDRRWGTSRWTLRRGELFLIPGDSPSGLRLPLDSLTWVKVPAEPDRSPFDEHPPLPEPVAHGESSAATDPVNLATVVPVKDCPPTALSFELRNGHVHVFLPPLVELEDAVELLAVIERASEETTTAIVLEGYAPPRDPRLQTVVVAPDPGVLEVNVHPASSWDELVDITLTVHDLARRVALGTETFQLDGRHSGTGGGNHITLGAAAAKDSPMLRRPDLLRSMITFWQHHPSLSYLFSGRFIGPTSQAPRVDEGRDETLYELEIAFAELDRLADSPPPWLVDRLLRHLLVDITGNTHRAEFCIDKLFSPDSERGRLGLLELRGFEMPPHPQMALVQSLLVRSLVARFWNEPYRGDPVRWGTELHDRFLLPHFCAADIFDVVHDLRNHGIGFDASWMAPFIEFRFPRLGSVDVGDVHLELRSAIEPWHVLGEEVSTTSTARYVDSSVERLQVKAVGLTEGRHVVTCNGVAVPLRPTQTPGTQVAGVRYRAWQPPSALHPTIGVHSPLTFDLIDLWSGRSVGGCRYHVSHPGGLAYETFPVNANSAEARRRSRFEVLGHTSGTIPEDLLGAYAGQAAAGRGGIAGALSGHEYPRTLDLRRVLAGEGGVTGGPEKG